jgi:hypothetical protein
VLVVADCYRPDMKIEIEVTRCAAKPDHPNLSL